MSGKVDEYGYPDFTADFDGRLISAAGGASGKLTLLNGQKIVFPWKRQQEIVGSEPGYIQVYDDPGSGVEYMILSAPDLLPGGPGGSILLAGWNDGTSSIILNGDPGTSLTLASGVVTSSKPVYSSGLVSNSGPLELASSSSLDATIDSGTGRDLYLTGSSDVFVKATTGVLSLQSVAGAITLSSATTTTITSTTSTAINATTNITLDSGSSGNITFTTNNGSLALNTLFGAWTAYTPTLTQSGTVTKTVTYSRYLKIGRLVTFSFLLSATAAGTGGNAVTISLPFTAAQAGNLTAGSGFIYDGASNNLGVWSMNTTTTIALVIAGGFYSAAIASGNSLTGTVVYEATT